MTTPPIDITRDELLTLAQAARRFPKVGGRRPSPHSLWRWCRRGVNGVTLAYVRVGRRIVTTPAAINAFVNALAAADKPPAAAPLPRPRTPRARQRAIEQAEEECAAAGL